MKTFPNFEYLLYTLMAVFIKIIKGVFFFPTKGSFITTKGTIKIKSNSNGINGSFFHLTTNDFFFFTTKSLSLPLLATKSLSSALLATKSLSLALLTTKAESFALLTTITNKVSYVFQNKRGRGNNRLL